MGIAGLLPFLKPCTRSASLREFSGCTAAVDAYVWLHRGAFACADRLARGETTDVYVTYCMRYVNLLLSHGIKPVLVMDGRPLPSKRETEVRRRENRARYRALAVQHTSAGRDREARECFQRCADVTPEMARQLMKACRARGVDCMVAPYEADAQLAYLARRGIADLVITEDSDLVLFGCPRVLFKMDATGNGRLIVSAALPACLGGSADKFTLERLRLVCILSGCDYLASLPGIGLGKASKLFVLAAGAADSAAILQRLPHYLGMRSLKVSAQYRADVLRAEQTFLYQLVVDPLTRKLLPLTAYPPGSSAEDFPQAGAPIDDDKAFQLALGNVDLKSGVLVTNFNPDRPGALPAHAPHKSIWSAGYVPARRSLSADATQPAAGVKRPVTAGKVARMSVLETMQKAAAAAAAARAEEERRRMETDVAALYGAPSPDETPGDSGVSSSGGTQGDGDDDDDHGVTDEEFLRLSACVETLSPSKDETQRYRQQPSTPPASTSASTSTVATLHDDISPTIGSGARRPRNPFRVCASLRSRLSSEVRQRMADGDGITKIVTSKYFATPEPTTEATTPVEEPSPAAASVPDPLRAPVQSMEEFLKRRRESSSSAASRYGDSSPKRSRRRSGGGDSPDAKPPVLPRLSLSSADGGSAADNWYKMSSVFDSKHAMTVWDSEVHGLPRSPSPQPPPAPSPRSPGKENSPLKRAQAGVSAPKTFLGRTPPPALFKRRSAPAAGAKTPRRSSASNGACKKLGLAKPTANRQLNLAQMFAFRKEEVPKLNR